MRKSNLKAGFLGAVLVCASLAQARVVGTFERHYNLSGPANLEVFTRSGDITVHSGPAGAISITGKIHVGDAWLFGDRNVDVKSIESNPPVRQDGNSVRIDYINMRNISIDYEITAPADTTVSSHTGSGDQTLDGLHARITLESGSGDVKLSRIEGEMSVHTGSGDVVADDVSGAFTGEAGSGDIRLHDRSGDVRIRTGSGNIELRDLSGGLHAEAGSGDVTAEGKLGGDWELRTGSGNVNVHIPSDTAFDVEARTSSGNLHIDAPVTMTVQGNVGREQHAISGKVRGGGHLMRVHTGSGDIHIE